MTDAKIKTTKNYTSVLGLISFSSFNVSFGQNMASSKSIIIFCNRSHNDNPYLLNLLIKSFVNSNFNYMYTIFLRI